MVIVNRHGCLSDRKAMLREKVFPSTNLFSLVCIQISHRRELFSSNLVLESWQNDLPPRKLVFAVISLATQSHLSFHLFMFRKWKREREKISNSLPWRVLLRALTAIDVITIKRSVVFQVVTFPLFAPLLAFCCCFHHHQERLTKEAKLDKRRQMMTVKSRKFSFASADEFLWRPIEIITKLKTQSRTPGVEVNNKPWGHRSWNWIF